MPDFSNNPLYAFSTEKMKKETYYFLTKKEEGRDIPIKLGDGTFGIVFKVYNETSELCAVKLLYNNQTEGIANIPKFKENVIALFAEKFKLKSSDGEYKKIQALLESNINSTNSFITKLLSLKLPPEKSTFLLKNVFDKASSVAVKRFQLEMESSKRIRERGVTDFTGIIEVISGTEKFKDSKAYTTLKPYFDSFQVDVSDYALVMPLYRETLKDLSV